MQDPYQSLLELCWQCDRCRATGVGYVAHCHLCQFDLCPQCAEMDIPHEVFGILTPEQTLTPEQAQEALELLGLGLNTTEAEERAAQLAKASQPQSGRPEEGMGGGDGRRGQEAGKGSRACARGRRGGGFRCY
jgi:hypothetical protein